MSRGWSCCLFCNRFRSGLWVDHSNTFPCSCEGTFRIYIFSFVGGWGEYFPSHILFCMHVKKFYFGLIWPECLLRLGLRQTANIISNDFLLVIVFFLLLFHQHEICSSVFPSKHSPMWHVELRVMEAECKYTTLYQSSVDHVMGDKSGTCWVSTRAMNIFNMLLTTGI